MSEYKPMTSESIDKLITALATAQGSFPEITCDLEAGGRGGRTYKYASLQNVLNSTRKALSENGIVFTQTIVPRDDMSVLVTMLLHSSGQYIASEYPMRLPQDPQSAGSMLTYFRRYSAIAILGVHPDYDDDGEAGGQKKEPPKKQDTQPEGKQPPANKQPAPEQKKHDDKNPPKKPPLERLSDELSETINLDVITAISGRWEGAKSHMTDEMYQSGRDAISRRFEELAKTAEPTRPSLSIGEEVPGWFHDLNPAEKLRYMPKGSVITTDENGVGWFRTKEESK